MGEGQTEGVGEEKLNTSFENWKLKVWRLQLKIETCIVQLKLSSSIWKLEIIVGKLNLTFKLDTTGVIVCFLWSGDILILL